MIDGAMVIVALALICTMVLGQCAPAYAEEEEEPEVHYVVTMITWYGETKPFKQKFSFQWQTACETFRITTTEKMEAYKIDPKFGFIMSDECKKELQK
jgi:hypothetical protein